jgi:gluconolactonase
MNRRNCIFWACLAGAALLTAAGCQSRPKSAPPALQTAFAPTGALVFGTIERLDLSVDGIIPPSASIEKLAQGFDWSEGPVWLARSDCLVFSDVPKNVVYRWKQGEGVSVFLKPSGYTGATARGGEPGSNGLTVDSEGRLVLCQHGDRRVARLEKDGRQTVLADRYEGKRFNSPNDLVFRSNGDLYFTDPPYGLEKGNDDPKKELPFNGVYRLKPNGDLTLLTRDLTFPNGIAFSPDEKTLYVAVSDPKHAVWMAYAVEADGALANGRVLLDVTAMVGAKKGLPDGMKVDRQGNLFATGPGGVLIISPNGKHIGTINTGQATANCAWGDDGSVLYITADMFLCRVKTSTKGKGF